MQRVLVLIVVLASSSITPARAALQGRVRPASAPRDGGTLHLASGTWTRKAAQAAMGADVVYDNTCPSPYYSPFSGDTFIDEGRLPSPTSPPAPNVRPGCATSYLVDGFEIAYCTDRANPGVYEVAFHQSWMYCDSLIGVPPTSSFAISGLPGSPSGALKCWSITIDLDSIMYPPLTFTMLADGDGTYAPPENSNLFAWSMRSALPVSQQTTTGPVVAGRPSACARGDGTLWDTAAVDYAEDGTGIGNLQIFHVEGGPTTPGCYFTESEYFGFHLELYTNACADSAAGVPYCFGDGSGTACPCGNASAVGAESGCLSSFGFAGQLTATGHANVNADSVVLYAESLPLTSTVLFFQGTSRTNGGAGSLFGDGLRCASGNVTRLVVRNTLGYGETFYPVFYASEPRISVIGGITSPGTRTYQAWYRNSASFCTPSVFNLTNGYEIAWSL